MRTFTRRAAIAGLGGMTIGGAFAGGSCHHLDLICPADPATTDPTTPLTIDVHSHVFNGTDLQITSFFNYVIALSADLDILKIFGPSLGTLGDFAPTGQQEIEALKSVENSLRKCDLAAARTLTERLREDRYQAMRRQLPAAYAASGARLRALGTDRRTAEAVDELGRQLQELEPTYARYREKRDARSRATALGITIEGGLDFVLRNFHYRYVNVHDYLEEYSRGKARKIDLLIAHPVDYDWPIGDGDETTTTLSEQIAVMERISRLTNGRVHGYVPFCPFKQVAFQRGLFKSNPFALVQDAVANRGCIGVKIYPPMGFKPLGNARLPASYWDGSHLPSRLWRPALGPDLDEALRLLYSWCKSNDVPIMAHTAPSNVPTKKFKELVNPSYWAAVATEFAGLRVNFGHFGHTGFVADQGSAAFGFMQQMTQGSSSGGGRFYADSSYFAEILSKPSEMKDMLAKYLEATSGKGDAALAQRLMYGTDWEMVVIEGRTTRDYLANFERVFGDLAKESSFGAMGDLGDRFFGLNAADHLGLAVGQATRARLDAFHRGAAKPPAWMAKLDDKLKPQAGASDPSVTPSRS